MNHQHFWKGLLLNIAEFPLKQDAQLREEVTYVLLLFFPNLGHRLLMPVSNCTLWGRNEGLPFTQASLKIFSAFFIEGYCEAVRLWPGFSTDLTILSCKRGLWRLYLIFDIWIGQEIISLIQYGKMKGDSFFCCREQTYVCVHLSQKQSQFKQKTNGTKCLGHPQLSVLILIEAEILWAVS